jgi:N-acetylglutamate synthase-like GNAT family acetyltransferase
VAIEAHGKNAGMPSIRRELIPGDLGAIVAMHGRLYALEHGLDATFEAEVAAGVAGAAARGWPGPREGIWMVEHESRVAGCLGLTDEGEDDAKLRWFLLDPGLHGRGLGRRLLEELLQKADASGYRRVSLETFSELRAAAHLYRSHGFQLVSAETGPRWGRAELTYQRYERDLSRAVPPSASPGAAGSVAR